MTAAAEKSKSRPLTVLQVLPQLVSGGVERGTLEIAEALVARGHRALVASAGGHLVGRLEHRGGLHFTLPLASKNIFTLKRNAKKLAALIKEWDVDIVHARSRAPAWSAWWAARATDTPFVTTFHGTYGHRGALKRAYNRVMTKGQRVIAPSQHILNHLRQIYHVPSEKIDVIARGVDLEQFHPHHVPSARVINLSRRWRIPEDKPVIVLPGRVTALKGHLLLLEALQLLPDNDYICLLVGHYEQNQYYKRLQQALVRSGLHEQVWLVGRTDDMPALYALADVVVVPSLKPESFGRVAAEAMAMGCLTIGAAHGGVAEVINAQSGFLFEPHNAQALAGALTQALNLSLNRRKAMLKAARKRIETQFSLSQMQEKTLAVYEKICHGTD